MVTLTGPWFAFKHSPRRVGNRPSTLLELNRLFYNIITLYLFVPNESESSYGNTSEFNVLALVPD